MERNLIYTKNTQRDKMENNRCEAASTESVRN